VPAEFSLALGSAYFRTGALPDAHLKQAEKAGFHVNPQLKADLAKSLAGG
jgi:hypothetical protein